VRENRIFGMTSLILSQGGPQRKKNPVPSPNVGKRRPARACAGNF
jgi:hypothetical protein